MNFSPSSDYLNWQWYWLHHGLSTPYWDSVLLVFTWCGVDIHLCVNEAHGNMNTMLSCGETLNGHQWNHYIPKGLFKNNTPAVSYASQCLWRNLQCLLSLVLSYSMMKCPLLSPACHRVPDTDQQGQRPRSNKSNLFCFLSVRPETASVGWYCALVRLVILKWKENVIFT